MARWDPSLWCCIPTAAIHLLSVESLPIYLAAYSWYHILVDVFEIAGEGGPSAAAALPGHGLANGTVYTPLGCTALPYMPLKCVGYVPLDPAGMRPPGAGGAAAGAAQHRKGMPAWFLEWSCLWFTLMAGGALLLFEVVTFACRGAPRSFGSGAYLCFAWELESTKCYKLMVATMALGPALFAICVVIGRLLTLTGRSGDLPFTAQHGALLSERLSASALPFAVLVISLITLAFPTMPVHNWHNTEFERVIFRRSLVDFILQSNDKFGIKLIDALWSAEHGHPWRLKSLLANPNDLNIIIMYNI